MVDDPDAMMAEDDGFGAGLAAKSPGRSPGGASSDEDDMYDFDPVSDAVVGVRSYNLQKKFAPIACKCCIFWYIQSPCSRYSEWTRSGRRIINGRLKFGPHTPKESQNRIFPDSRSHSIHNPASCLRLHAIHWHVCMFFFSTRAHD